MHMTVFYCPPRIPPGRYCFVGVSKCLSVTAGASPSLSHFSRPLCRLFLSSAPLPRGVSGTYRIDGVGLVDGDSGVTYVANLTDMDWLAYTVMTEEAVYDVTFQVGCLRFGAYCSV